MEGLGFLLFLLFLGWLGSAVLTCNIGERKGYSGCGWLIAGLIFSPLALIIVLILPMREKERDALAVKRGQKKICPFCAEPIQRAAKVCRYCGKSLLEQ